MFDLLDLDDCAGVVYVAFGGSYAKAGCVAAKSLRKYCPKVPIHVVTNLRSKRERGEWPEGTTFTELSLPDKLNRDVRTRLVEYSPFERTLLLDADTLVVNSDVTLPLRYLQFWDVCVVSYHCMAKFRGSDQWRPIRQALGTPWHYTMCGGMFYFSKNERVEELFKLWNKYWIEEGRGRDMPGLFRATWSSRARVLFLPGREYWIGKDKGCVLHSAGQLRGLPSIEKFKPNALDEHGKKRRWIKVSKKV